MSELLEYATIYMATKLNTDNWYGLSETDKNKYFLEAERQIKSIDGIELPETYTDNIKSAICEVALELTNAKDNAIFDKYQKAGVTSISYGNDSVSFDVSKATKPTNISYVNDFAYSLLRAYIKRSFPIV